MHKVFLPIYRYLRGHRAVMYTLLIVSSFVFLYFGLQLRYEEDVVKLLPRSSIDSELAFSDIGLEKDITAERLEAADKIILGRVGGKMVEFPHGHALRVGKGVVEIS